MPPEITDAPADTTPDFLESSLAAISGLNDPEKKPEEDNFLESIASELEVEPKPDAKAGEKPEAKVEVTDDLDEVGLPKNPPGKASPKAREGWDALRSEVKTARQEKETLAAERDAAAKALKELQEKVAVLPELEAKAKFADEAEKELAISRIESTKQFQDVVIKPLDAIGAAIDEFAKRNEIEVDALDAAISERNASKRSKMLDSIISGVGEADKFELYQMVRDTHSILARQDELHAKAVEARKELDARTQEETEKSSRENKAKFESSVKRTAEVLKDRIPFEALAEGETLEAILGDLTTKAVSSDYTAASTDVQSYSVFAGLLLPRLIKQYRAVEGREKSAQARIKELTNASPATTVDSKAAPTDASGDDFLKAIEQDLYRK